MLGFDSYLKPLDYCDSEDEPLSSAYLTLFLLTGFAVGVCSAIKFAESNNRFNYESRLACIISGFLMLTMRLLHTKQGDLEFDGEGSIVAMGPHRTAVEAFVVASRMTRTPPQFFATDAFNFVPGVSSFLKMFKVISIKADPRKEKGQTSNSDALELAGQVLQNKGCVALFPQGNFAKLGQDPHKIYNGAAKLALMQKAPIRVIRLDGFWCLENPLIPLFIRNNAFYRVFLSMFHMNNIRTTLCCVIDFHLKPENQSLSDDEKINEICAQLYAYFRDTKELTDKQIGIIKTQISNKTHLLIWENKVQQDGLGKKISVLKKEATQWEVTSVPSPN